MEPIVHCVRKQMLQLLAVKINKNKTSTLTDDFISNGFLIYSWFLVYIVLYYAL